MTSRDLQVIRLRRPVSRKDLKIVDSRFRGNDNIVGFMQLCKALVLQVSLWFEENSGMANLNGGMGKALTVLI